MYPTKYVPGESTSNEDDEMPDDIDSEMSDSEVDDGDPAEAVATASTTTPVETVPGSSEPSNIKAPSELYNGNAHSPSYYQKKMKSFDKVRYLRKTYRPGMVKTMDGMLAEWKQEVPSCSALPHTRGYCINRDRFCREVAKEP